MRVFFTKVYVAYFGFMCLYACADPQSSAPFACGSYAVISQGTTSNLGAVQRVVTTNEDFLSVWRKIRSLQSPLPKIDFTKETVIVVGMENKPTGGYAVNIAGVRCTNDKTVISIAYRNPRSSRHENNPENIEIVTSENSQPYIIARIAKPTGKIIFTEVSPQ